MVADRASVHRSYPHGPREQSELNDLRSGSTTVEDVCAWYWTPLPNPGFPQSPASQLCRWICQNSMRRPGAHVRQEQSGRTCPH